MFATMLIREEQTDLSPFPEPQLEAARTQWLHELHRRLSTLNDALSHSHSEMEYGGAVNQARDIGPLEDAVDEARRMVCALGGEMRRRSEGELPVWKIETGSMGSEGELGRRLSTA